MNSLCSQPPALSTLCALRGPEYRSPECTVGLVCMHAVLLCFLLHFATSLIGWTGEMGTKYWEWKLEKQDSW